MKRTFLLFAVVAVAMLYACSKDAAAVDEAQSATPETAKTEIPTPLTFAQTRQIVADVLGDAVATKITPTRCYVKFTFETPRKATEVFGDEKINYFKTPIAEDSWQQTQPNVLYALVENKDVEYPKNATVEILGEYFNPESPYSGLTAEQAAKVVAHINSVQGIEETRAGLSPYEWNPWGIIRIYDEILGDYTPLRFGIITVVGNELTSFSPIDETVSTDADGYFKCTKAFYGPATFTLNLGTKRWSVVTDQGGIASVSDRKNMQSWRLDIGPDTPNRLYQYATAYRATILMEWYSKHYITNGVSKVYIKCPNTSVPANADDSYKRVPDENPLKLNLDATIYCKDKSNLDIYNTVHRIMGKAAHYIETAGTNQDGKFTRIITESWGEFTKYYFAEKEYQELGALQKLHTYTTQYGGVLPRPDALNRQLWSYTTYLNPNDTYHLKTPLFIDLYDTFNQHSWPEIRFTEYNFYPHDRISLPDYEELWTMACRLTTVSQIKTVTRNKLYEDQQSVDDLFDVYERLVAQQAR